MKSIVLCSANLTNVRSQRRFFARESRKSLESVHSCDLRDSLAKHLHPPSFRAFSCPCFFLSSFAEKIWNNRGLRGWHGLKKIPSVKSVKSAVKTNVCGEADSYFSRTKPLFAVLPH